MVYEGLRTGVLQFSDDAGAHVYHLLVVVGNPLVDYALLYGLFRLLVEESQQQAFRLVKREDFQLVGVFYVHYLIADVVCRLHEVYQRMAGVGEGSAGT